MFMYVVGYVTGWVRGAQNPLSGLQSRIRRLPTRNRMTPTADHAVAATWNTDCAFVERRVHRFVALAIATLTFISQHILSEVSVFAAGHLTT